MSNENNSEELELIKEINKVTKALIYLYKNGLDDNMIALQISYSKNIKISTVKAVLMAIKGLSKRVTKNLDPKAIEKKIKQLKGEFE